jgi:hypothetical protein
MAAQKATKLKSFFNGHRRGATLNTWAHLKTRAGEDRIKLDIHMPLLNQNLKGMDSAISEAFTVMAKDDSKIERSSLNVELEGFTLDIFATDESKRRSATSTGVRMQKLAVVASGEGERRELELHLVAYIPASIDLRDWAWTHLHKSFWMEAVYSQTELDFDGAEEEEEGEEDGDTLPLTQPPPGQRVKVMPPAAKSGPKQLAAFHEQEVSRGRA